MTTATIHSERRRATVTRLRSLLVQLTAKTTAAWFATLTAGLALLQTPSSAEPGDDLRVSVENLYGVPTFTVNGEPFALPCFETYVPTEHYFRQFADAGVKLFCFNTNVAECDYGHSKPTWIGPKEWDYSGFDERAERVLRANPDAMLMPRVNMGTPRWWLDAHPEEMEVLHHGGVLYRDPNTNPTVPTGRPFPSIASQKWRSDMSEALRRFLQHVEDSKYAPHVFGYILTGLDTEEWYPWSSGSNQLSGYSKSTQAAFRKWLQGRYKTVAALRKAWRSPDVTFETATTPSFERRMDQAKGAFRNVARDIDVIDFYIFYNELIPDTIDCFAQVARSCVGPEKALGAFYGYMYEFSGDPEYGHNALEKFNESPFLDFVYVTANYSYRQAGTGGDYARAPSYSVRLHDKLWYNDNDVVSFLAPEVMTRLGWDESRDWTTSLQHHLKVLGYTETPRQTKWMYRRSLGFAICNGAYTSYFDLHGGYYDDPELMEEVASLNRVAAASAERDRSSVSEILVVADEDSNAYATFRSPIVTTSMADTPPLFLKLGAPQDHILLGDLDLADPSRYKMVVFLNCYHMTEDERQLIRQKWQNSDRTLVWCYAPGRFSESDLASDDAEALTGISLTHESRQVPLSTAISLLDSADPLASRLRTRSRLPHMPNQAANRIDPAESEPTADLFYVDDSRATPVAVEPAGGRVTMAVRRLDDWTSIYVFTPVIPSAAWRELAREAGVHLYAERDDTFYANESYLCVHADGAGRRTIALPESADVHSVTGPKLQWNDVDSFELDMEHGETVLLEWKRSSRPRTETTSQ